MLYFFFSRNFSGCGRFIRKGHVLLFVLLIFLGACQEDVLYPEYRLEMPDIPLVWAEILGPPRWHIEWVNKDGAVAWADTEAFSLSVSLLDGWTHPVIAYPYWSSRDISPGVMKPCGAIYPLDVVDGKISLSWQGGVDAVFYRELSKGDNDKRRPQYFDWKRFRTLFRDEEKLNITIRADPWLADWKDIAKKTVASGFSALKIIPGKTENYTIDIPEDGPWMGTSPFAGAFAWEKEKKTVLQVSSTVDLYFCPKGILRCKKDIWIFEYWSE